MNRSISWQLMGAPSPAEVGAPAVEQVAEDAEEEATTSVVDGGSQAISNSLQTGTPCSCDCCQVQKLLPINFIKQPSGDQITSACFKSGMDPTSGAGDANAICPYTCQISKDNQILTATKGQVDYNRFCNYNCQPVTDAPGTACVQFSGEDYKAASADANGGNGADLYPQPVLGINSGFGSGATPRSAPADNSAAAAADAPAAAAEAAGAPAAAPKAEGAKVAMKKKAAPQEKLKIVYDMRKLIAERLRSEAGAAVASGAAAAERVRINEWTTKQNAELLKKIRTQYGAMAGKVEEGVSAIEADKNTADESEIKTKTNLAEGRIFASAIVKETRKLADDAIKMAVAPCSAMAAKDRAEAKGLDKPEDWVKVVAARAANPYQKAVTDAVQRTSEYKNLADGLIGQAYGAQKQANDLIPHVNVLEAQGDVIGATIERKQVTNLLGRAKALEAQAKGYYNTAVNTRQTIPKWQMAASQAAAYAAWEYSNNAQAFR